MKNSKEVEMAFSKSAHHYDREFSYTHIGKVQRSQVRTIVNKYLCNVHNKEILELNCGTGEDAHWLLQYGTVLATDISTEMIKISESKFKHENLKFLVLDINQLNLYLKNKNFDVVFSNFGGLNCLDENQLKTFFENISYFVKPKATLFLVFMSQDCLWEKLYYLLKLKWHQLFYRHHKDIIVQVCETKIIVNYYSPNLLKKIIGNQWQFQRVKPIGFFVPPTYLNSFFQKHPFVFKTLTKLDTFIKNFNILSNFSDHFLFIIQRK